MCVCMFVCLSCSSRAVLCVVSVDAALLRSRVVESDGAVVRLIKRVSALRAPSAGRAEYDAALRDVESVSASLRSGVTSALALSADVAAARERRRRIGTDTTEIHSAIAATQSALAAAVVARERNADYNAFVDAAAPFPTRDTSTAAIHEVQRRTRERRDELRALNERRNDKYRDAAMLLAAVHATATAMTATDAAAAATAAATTTATATAMSDA